MIEIATITNEAGLARLRPEWEELWRRDPAATPFQSPAWLLAWWRFFGTPEPRILTARAADQLVGLLPLYLLRENGCCKLLSIGIGLSDYIEALRSPNIPEIGQMFMAAIAAMPEWDECWLPDLTPEGALARAVADCGLADLATPAPPCPVLALPSDPSKLHESVPRKTLRDLRQARTRAATAGAVVIEVISEETLDAAMDELFQLHQQRWRSRGECGVCNDPRVQDFHRAAASALLGAGMLRIYRLSLNDAVLAVYYGFAAKGRSYAYLGGFDPLQPRLSPGMQVIAYAIEQAIAEGVTSFDFLRGEESYKYAWGAVDRPKMSRSLSRQC
ncbi:MAG: GNAT family N-acetyltransferase [Stellaceae bacterium]